MALPLCQSDCYNATLAILQNVVGSPRYSTIINPGTQTSSPITIMISFSLIKLLQLSTTGIISIASGLSMSWTDPRLSWNASDYNNVSAIEVLPSQIWLPSLTLVNGVSESLKIPVENESVCAILSTGYVMATLATQFTATCQMDLNKFPYDSQTCTFVILHLDLRNQFVSMHYTVDPLQDTLATSIYTPSGEFNLNNVTLTVPNGTFGMYSNIYVVLSFSRNPNYYIINMAMPSVLLLIASGIVLLLPSENSVKITMACSLMVSQYVLQQAVSRMLPAAKTTPLLANGIMYELCLGCFSLCASVFTVRLHSMKLDVPTWLLKIAKRMDRRTTSKRKVSPAVKSATETSIVTDDCTTCDNGKPAAVNAKQRSTALMCSKAEALIKSLDQSSEPLAAGIAIMAQAYIMQVELIENAESRRIKQSEKENNWRLVDNMMNFSFFIIYAIIGTYLCLIYLMGFWSQ